MAEPQRIDFMLRYERQQENPKFYGRSLGHKFLLVKENIFVSSKLGKF